MALVQREEPIAPVSGWVVRIVPESDVSGSSLFLVLCPDARSGPDFFYLTDEETGAKSEEWRGWGEGCSSNPAACLHLLLRP